MTTYNDLHWDSLNFVKKHLYRQLATPLNHALGRLAIAEHVGGGELSQEQFRRTAHSLEIALNMLRAWTVLVHVKNGGTIRPDQRRPLAPGALPRWLVDHLKAQTSLQVENTQPLHVHLETFYQSLLLICEVGAAIGTLKQLVIMNANHGRTGVWVRAVFSPPPTGAYKGLSAVQHHLQANTQADHDVTVQLQVLTDFLALNGATLKVQNNTETGEQALAALLPVYDEALADQPEAAGDSLYAHLARELDKTPAAQELVQDKHVQSESDEPSTAGKPRLARPVLAPTPQEISESPESGSVTLGDAAVDEGDGDVENQPDTLIVPPPDLRDRMAAALGDPDQPPAKVEHPPDEVENQPETLILPPDGLRERIDRALLEHEESEAEQQAETEAASGDVDANAAESGAIGVVTIENLPETLIVPPPDFRRRLVTPPAPENPCPDATVQASDRPSPENEANDQPDHKPAADSETAQSDAAQEASASAEPDTDVESTAQDSPEEPARQDS